LFHAAETRPLHEITVVRTGKKQGTRHSNVRESIKAKATRLGLERKMIYATMIYTGLRKSELASISIGQAFLDHEIPHLVLKAKHAKSRRGAILPLHPQLVPRLREWLNLKTAQGKLSPKEKLFHVPDSLCKILNRDLKFAGIEKRDVLDRVVDVHALRHTHATILAKRGVSPKVAQSSMRHSCIRLTMNVYTHLELTDVAEGVKQIPDFFE
jgi:integrase